MKLRSDRSYGPPTQDPVHALASAGIAPTIDAGTHATTTKAATRGSNEQIPTDSRKRARSGSADSQRTARRPRTASPAEPLRSSPMANVPYSSSQLLPVVLSQENTHGSIVPATRQVFKMGELEARDRLRDRERESYDSSDIENLDTEALLVKDNDGNFRMAILEEPLSESYELQGGEVLRPITPGLQAAFEAESSERELPTAQDHERYAAFRRRHERLLTDPRVTEIRAAENIRFDIAHQVKDGDFFAIEVPPDADLKIGTSGVADCIGCGAVSPSTTKPGWTVLALTHYTGVDQDTREVISPRECLEKLVATLVAKGGDPDLGRMEITMAGGLYSNSVGYGFHLDDEDEFLSLAGEFPIVAARMQTTSVDLNSQLRTIPRHTEDDHESSINIALSVGGLYYSHAPLW